MKGFSFQRAIAAAFAIAVPLFASGCSGGATSSGSSGQPAPQNPAAVLPPNAPRAMTMKLSDGEVVNVQPAAEPPKFSAADVPAQVLAAVQNHRELAMGSFHSKVEADDMQWSTNIPPPAGGSIGTPTPISSASKQPFSKTGSAADHSTYGWYIDGYDGNPNYKTEGYVEFAADMGLPTLYPEAAGGSGFYVYYAPTTQGNDGNPLEVGLATGPDWPYAGPQNLFIYDWASASGNTPCAQSGYPACVGFTTYAPKINSSFTSDYVRVLGHGVPEWSIETFESGTTWYFAIYNHNTGAWDIPYSEPHTEIRHNFSTGKNGPAGGHGYFEYYLPPKTACAGADPDVPATADTYETDAQQYSATTKTWVRVSVEPYLTTGLTGAGVCFVGPSAPYFSTSDFGDGWSDWEAMWE